MLNETDLFSKNLKKIPIPLVFLKSMVNIDVYNIKLGLSNVYLIVTKI